jgi:hypothetical protein
LSAISEFSRACVGSVFGAANAQHAVDSLSRVARFAIRLLIFFRDAPAARVVALSHVGQLQHACAAVKQSDIE